MNEVDICNVALSHIGDAAEVASINPSDGSMQSALCTRYYNITRNSLLEMHPWGFATRRVSLALKPYTVSPWDYAYGIPSDAVNLLEVYAADASDDYSAPFPMSGTPLGVVNSQQGVYTPQPFVAEMGADNQEVIYTNTENAVLRYTALITDPTKFSPLFVECLSWLLAAKIAGPLMKGAAGMQMSKSCLQAFQFYYKEATESDANQRRSQVIQSTPWMVGR
jgi:hypothetical protein